MDIDAAIARVRAFARAKGWSVYKLADEAGLGSTQTLMRMYEPDWNPRAATLRKLGAVIPPDFVAADPSDALSQDNESSVAGADCHQTFLAKIPRNISGRG